MAVAERDFLLLAGHMQNEINSLHKVFAWCLHSGRSGTDSSIESLANGAQAMIYARVLAGKLYEAWGEVGKAWFGSKLSQRLEPKLHPVAREANAKLKAYFSRSNTIYRVRNSFAFHYSATEIGAGWEQVADDLTFEVVLGGTVGNNLYLGAELAANAALLKAVDQANPEQGLRVFFDEVQSTTANFTDFLEGAIMAILEDLFGTDIGQLGREEDIFPILAFSQVEVPYFCLPDTSK
ncbi:MAG TPA: hypothetical protein VMV48_09485 [Gallionellaceae bacterium]|nr:hypothetical protein [Gallionellaceae bacterium]